MAIVIDKSKLYFRDFRFLAASASKDETRPFMQGIHVETDDGQKIFVCTDGRRMHIARINVDIPDGEYKILINTQSNVTIEAVPPDTYKFPDWRKVDPPETVTFFRKQIVSKKTMYETLFKLYYLGLYVNNIFIEPLDGNEWDMETAAHETIFEKVLVFETTKIYGSKLRAVIMGLAKEETVAEVIEAEKILDTHFDKLEAEREKRKEFEAKTLAEAIKKAKGKKTKAA